MPFTEQTLSLRSFRGLVRPIICVNCLNFCYVHNYCIWTPAFLLRAHFLQFFSFLFFLISLHWLKPYFVAVAFAIPTVLMQRHPFIRLSTGLSIYREFLLMLQSEVQTSIFWSNLSLYDRAHAHDCSLRLNHVLPLFASLIKVVPGSHASRDIALEKGVVVRAPASLLTLSFKLNP